MKKAKDNVLHMQVCAGATQRTKIKKARNKQVELKAAVP